MFKILADCFTNPQQIVIFVFSDWNECSASCASLPTPLMLFYWNTIDYITEVQPGLASTGTAVACLMILLLHGTICSHSLVCNACTWPCWKRFDARRVLIKQMFWMYILHLCLFQHLIYAFGKTLLVILLVGYSIYLLNPTTWVKYTSYTEVHSV